MADPIPIEQPMMAPGMNPQPAGFFMPEETEEKPSAAKAKLLKFIDNDNIASGMDEGELMKIGRRCVDEYDIDEESRKEWMERNKSAIELANQTKKGKTFPWEGAANIKLPLIADASIKFAARAYSEIIRDGQVVKGKVTGRDPNGQKADRANRVAEFMSWQYTEQMSEWEGDTDKLLHVLPVVGHLFRKTYYCAPKRRSTSELVMPDKLCVNYSASSLASARRQTHIIDMHHNQVVELQRAGQWLDIEFNTDEKENEPDTDQWYQFLEQHRYLDLDDDGYEEPYIITVHRDSGKVARIVARYEESGIKETQSGEIGHIEPIQYFSDYGFIPSFDGGYYHVGFGALLEPLNETANTIFNQLLDSGSLNNLQGGYLSKEVKIKGGRAQFRLGEWKRTEASAEQLRNGVFPLPTKEPSSTLFNLLGLVMELTQDLASVKDVLSGDTPSANIPATTVMALIEQSMKTFNAIYKRIYRALKNEFTILYKLNYRHMDEEEYFRVLDNEQIAYRQDFESESMDISPVADPYVSSDIQRLGRSQALKEYIGVPGVDPEPILKYSLEALRVDPEMVEQIVPPKDPNAMPPELMALQHEVEMKQADIAAKEQELSIKEREVALKEKEMEYKALDYVSKAIKNFADAEAAEAGQQIASYKSLADIVLRQMEVDNTQKATA